MYDFDDFVAFEQRLQAPLVHNFRTLHYVEDERLAVYCADFDQGDCALDAQIDALTVNRNHNRFVARGRLYNGFGDKFTIENIRYDPCELQHFDFPCVAHKHAGIAVVIVVVVVMLGASL